MAQTAARLLSLLSLLQSRRVWSGGELATRLAVSRRTVRNDMSRLRQLGYAVEGTRGEIGGYRLGAAGAAMPPLLLDADEATAVAVGLRTGVNCIIGGMEETSLRALTKLEQILPSRARTRLRTLNHYTVPLPSNRPMPLTDPSLLTHIAGLCHGRERLRFSYDGDAAAVEPDGDMPPVRDVEPYRLVNRAHRWYLLGYDVAADRWADFRVDQMRPRSPTGPKFVPRELGDRDIASYITDRIDQPTSQHTAVVVVQAPAGEVAEWFVTAEATIQPIDQHTCTVHFRAESLRTIALSLGRLDADFTITAPAELREEVSELAARYARASTRTVGPEACA